VQEDAAPWHNTLPLQGVGGLDAHVMDGLLQWLRHIEWALLQLRQEHTPAEWVDVCRQLIDKFFKASNDADERLLERAMAPLETWLNECNLARFDEPVALQVLREHWMNQLQQPAMHQRFFGGGVQFATLMPMRSIPFEVVCLLGMNDADYPRRQTPRDFDLMRHATADDNASVMWRAGDRSRREDDRYLFLEALLSARAKLYISWQGRRATDHEVMPPSVLVSQLMDHLNACWSPACDAPLQPLQAFSSQYFEAGSKFSTYASDWQPKAVANEDIDHGVNRSADEKVVAATPKEGHANSDAPSHLTAQDLRRLLRQPVDVFFHDRLRTRLDTPNPDMAQEEPFALDKLQTYKLVSQMAFAQLKGASLADVLAPLRLQGHLALAGFGEVQEKHLQTQCQTLTEKLSPLLADWPHDLPVQSANFKLDQTVLQAQWADADTVWKQNAEGTACLQIDIRAGAVVEGKAKHRVPRVHMLTDVWVSHLLACASGLHTTSIQVGLNGVVQFDAIDAATALAHLQALVEAYQAARQQLLPVARKTACAYLMAKQNPELDPSEAAENAFVGNARQPGEQPRSEHLKRAFDGYGAIAINLPAWAQRLYGPMVVAAHLWANEDEAEGEAA
jgi:exodeoxyribonuclease V gamma subunit